MPVICQCPSCKTKFQIGDQYAGRTVKCRKCSTAIAVPAIAEPARSASESAPTSEESDKRKRSRLTAQFAELPANDAAIEEDTDDAPSAEDGLGFLAEVSATPKGRTAPAVAAQSSRGGSAAGDAVSTAGFAARSAKDVFPRRSKQKPKGLPAWLIATMAAVGVVAVVGIVFMIYRPSLSKAKPDSGSAAAASAANDGKKAVHAGPKRKVPMLTIDWPEDQRGGAALFINDDKTKIPAKGPIEIPLPPSKEQYRVRLQRRGFQPKSFARASQEDDQLYTVTAWEPLLKGIDWEQDFEAAKKVAKDHNKDVFLLFDASDSPESSFASGRFAEVVAGRKEFRERADRDYVCVYIDNPKNAAGQGRVANGERNRQLTEKFRISVFPTVVVTDAKGRPFGVLEDCKISGIKAFLELMTKWTSDRKNLFELLAKVDALPKDSPDSDLMGKALNFLETNKLDRFYRGTMKELTARMAKGENTQEMHAHQKRE